MRTAHPVALKVRLHGAACQPDGAQRKEDERVQHRKITRSG
jgi:hypothetical protein